ncbi:glycosyltransferase family 9 protein [bacterium]|nr:glycosyltransferase family 9 protein [bacterium]
MFAETEIKLNNGDSILLIQLRAMGDTLLLTPLIRTFKEVYPAVKIDVLVEALPAQVLKNNPHVRKIHISPPRGSGFGKYILLLRRLRHEKYVLSVDFLSTPGSALLSRLINSKLRIGYRLRWRSWAYTHPVQRRTDPVYNPLTKFDLVSMLGVKPDDLKLDLYYSDDDDAVAAELWSALNFSEPSIVCALAPWSKREWRRWANPAWLKVMKQVSMQKPVIWLLFATENERRFLSELEDNPDVDIRWAGASDIGVAAAMIKRCQAMLSVDNGLAHIAVAMNIPKLSLFTGSDAPELWTPPGSDEFQGVDLREEKYEPSKITEVADRFVMLLKFGSNLEQ